MAGCKAINLKVYLVSLKLHLVTDLLEAVTSPGLSEMAGSSTQMHYLGVLDLLPNRVLE